MYHYTLYMYITDISVHFNHVQYILINVIPPALIILKSIQKFIYAILSILCKFGLVACINCCVFQENQNEGSLTSSNQLKNKMVQRQMSLNFNSQRKTEKTSERLWWTLSCKFIWYIMRHVAQWEKYIWKTDGSKYCFEKRQYLLDTRKIFLAIWEWVS